MAVSTRTPTYDNATRQATAAATTTTLRSPYGYANLQASAVVTTSASATAKSGATSDMLNISPLLAFIGAVVVLSRL